ncbi:PTS sugar transporter subunit IIA [Agrilactobacillus fermenti]|uniref:PTS sugar transporter subunit IIA n=1 Tax=Agrilactobacillus fermenti TaxID=2586909 RepID=UPI0038B251BA
MFKFFGKKKQIDNQVYAPATGELVDISQVSDKVFSSKAMGEGFGIQPNADQIVAPVSGTVSMVASTKHAIGITMANGLEVLIHMGVDTVDLKGAPFEIQVAADEPVTGGQPIATMDLAQVKAANLDTVIIVVITNSADKLGALNVAKGPVEQSQVVGTVTTK